MTKFVTVQEAAALIGNNVTLAASAFGGFGSTDELYKAIRKRFLKEGAPRNLTVIKSVSIGDKATRGLNYIGLEGLIGRVITSHVGLEPAVAKLVSENKCLAYMVPLGTIMKLYRAAAAKQPGILTDIGLDTCCDPRLEGGKANAITVEQGPDIVSLMNIDGRDYLFYKTIPIDVCLIRGTYADETGTISMEKEAVSNEELELAAATHDSGGIVIVQVEDIVPQGTLDPRLVKLHHFMVDYVVKAKPENHRQGFDRDEFRPELTGATRVQIDALDPMPLNDRKICGRRALMELRPGSLVNLGIGMPQTVAAVAAEENVADQITLSIESGVLGGVPLQGLGIGATINPEAMYKMPDILDIYDGGGLDMSVLGLAEIDTYGNVNVSKFNGHVVGPGGFIDISRNTPKVIFVGTFLAGKQKKFKNKVEQVTFSGKYSIEHGQQVVVATERAVFRLTRDGLMLTEIAPGFNLEKDILENMEFRPVISPDLKEMDPRIFQEGPMGL